MLDLALGGGHFIGDDAKGFFVVFGFRQDLQFLRLVQRPGDAVQRAQRGLQPGPFLAQRLGPLRIGPDIRIFQRALDLGEALPLRVIVKDTP